MQKLNRCFYLLFLFWISLTLSSCGSSLIAPNFAEQNIPPPPDYSKSQNWAVLPTNYTKQFKDLVPQDPDTLKADVFYVYPTLLTRDKDMRWNVATSDAEQNLKVLETAVYFQASAWASSAKLYVPFYRQAHLRSYSNLDSGGEEALMLAYSDIKAAFETYLKVYNKGRPIIIAGHSQGATHCSLLLKDFFDGKALQKQLVAAYIPGIGIKKDQFKTINAMTRPEETGGLLSWNTFKRKRLPEKYELWYKGTITSNPVTWNAEKFSKREDHKGFLYKNSKLYDQALKLELIDGMLWTSLPRFPMRIFAIFKKNYHVGDVNLFWKDIQKNSELRVRSWISGQNSKPIAN